LRAGFRGLPVEALSQRQSEEKPSEFCMTRAIRVVDKGGIAFAKVRFVPAEGRTELRSPIFMVLPLFRDEHRHELRLGHQCSDTLKHAPLVAEWPFAGVRFAIFAIDGESGASSPLTKGFLLPCEAGQN
jgi:hypothetical protein